MHSYDGSNEREKESPFNILRNVNVYFFKPRARGVFFFLGGVGGFGKEKVKDDVWAME